MTATVNAGRGIVTPQGVVLDLQAAGIGYRGLARVVDIAILLVLFLLLFTFSGFIGGTAAFVIQVVGGFLLIFGYPIVAETFFRGRTVGKLVAGIRVVSLEAGPIGFREAFIRSIFQIVDLIASFGAVALVAGMVTMKTQRLGDLAAGTFVVRDPRAQPYVPAIPFTPPMGAEGLVASLDVTKLRPEQERIIRSFLLRVGSLSKAARADLGNRLATNTARTLGHDPRFYGLTPEPYLASIMAAHQLREGGLAELAIE